MYGTIDVGKPWYIIRHVALRSCICMIYFPNKRKMMVKLSKKFCCYPTTSTS